MSVTLRRMDPTGTDRQALVEFLTDHEWPFHVGSHPTRAEVERLIDAGAFGSEETETWWIDTADEIRVGLVRFEDLPDAPMLDLRLGERARGRGLDLLALRAATHHVFTSLPGVHRFEGTTRADNIAMRRTFERGGWVKECHYRQAWPTADGRLLDSVGYAILRPDWESGTTTPVPQDGAA